MVHAQAALHSVSSHLQLFFFFCEYESVAHAHRFMIIEMYFTEKCITDSKATFIMNPCIMHPFVPVLWNIEI